MRLRGGRLCFGLVAGVALLFGCCVDDLAGACWFVAAASGALSVVSG